MLLVRAILDQHHLIAVGFRRKHVLAGNLARRFPGARTIEFTGKACQAFGVWNVEDRAVELGSRKIAFAGQRAGDIDEIT